MAALTRISMTPVKGTALIHPASVQLTSLGIPANRRFYLIDDGGELFSAFDHGALMSIVASYDPDREHLSLAFPDGPLVEGCAVAEGSSVRTDFHGRAVDGRIVGGPWAEALSSFSGIPVRMVRTERDGEGTDVEPLTIVSSASVAELGRRGGHDGPLDARRFRIDLEIDGLEPYEEDTWAGHRVSVGTSVIEVGGQIPRCRVTTMDPRTGTRDWETLTQIARSRPRIEGDGGLPFGMYARVVVPGEAHVGDEVALLQVVDTAVAPRS